MFDVGRSICLYIYAERKKGFTYMKIIKLIYCTIFFSMFCTSLSLASPCSEEDKKYAEVWNNYYDPQEAFDFGETIKKK